MQKFAPARVDAMSAAFGIIVLLNSCSPSGQTEIPPSDRPPTPDEISKWRAQQDLSVATDEELSTAKRCEKPFSEGRALSNDGKLKAVFQLGNLIGGNNSNLSTTSSYTLLDAKGNKLAEAPSCLAEIQGSKKNELGDQMAWFAPDGKRVVVYEYFNCGLGPPPLTILFYEDEKSPGTWKCRFLELPYYDKKFYHEGAHSECRGIVGDELLIDAMTRDGKVSKKKISALADKYPFPFSIG